LIEEPIPKHLYLLNLDPDKTKEQKEKGNLLFLTGFVEGDVGFDNKSWEDFDSNILSHNCVILGKTWPSLFVFPHGWCLTIGLA
jgi:hypothetical protein